MIDTRLFGNMQDGTEVFIYTLTNKNGIRAEITNYGGIIASLWVPDRMGNMDDILLGYDRLEDYLINPPYFGAIIGRNANRIKDGAFTLNGVKYNLNKNNGENHLHGGMEGFDKKVWDVRIITDDQLQSLELSLFSPDGEEKYPGNLETRVIYTLTDSNELIINYYAVSDQDTIVNLTNHSYFNLSGNGSDNVLGHVLKLNADFYTPITENLIPTGEILSVKNTPFDFTSPREIGDGLINHAHNEQMRNGSGYDHNFVLNVSGETPEEAAEVYDPKTGRVLRVLTTSPGVQLYTGNSLEGSGRGKGGISYKNRDGFCLETQHFPNAVNLHHFPSPVLRAGTTYHQTTIFKFETRV